MFFFSPLEQFGVFPLIPLNFGFFDLSITNEFIISILTILFISISVFALLRKNNKGLLAIPSGWQGFFESVHKLVLSLVLENIKDKTAAKFFPFVFVLFLFVASSNLFGLVPYSFTITAHIVVTLFVSVSTFVGINIICAKKHGVKMFSLFLPSGTSALLAFLLIPIEFISYIFKPISLSIRLFANMMAGHTLLKVIVGFAYTLMGVSGLLFFIHLVPLFILLPLFALELGVALIQSFVFSILICIYVNDCLNLH